MRPPKRGKAQPEMIPGRHRVDKAKPASWPGKALKKGPLGIQQGSAYLRCRRRGWRPSGIPSPGSRLERLRPIPLAIPVLGVHWPQSGPLLTASPSQQRAKDCELCGHVPANECVGRSCCWRSFRYNFPSLAWKQKASKQASPFCMRLSGRGTC